MIVYNVTVKVDAAVVPQWLHWLRTEHGPEVVATGCFYTFQVLHLLEMDDAEGPTYAVQFSAHAQADYERYITRFANHFQNEAIRKWGSRFVSFSTLMQVVG